MSDQCWEDAMFGLLSEPPPPEAVAKITAIEGVRIVPTALTTQQGSDGTSDQRRRPQC
jgi:hypothetical protein